MAAAMGPIVFVVVVFGGLGSWPDASSPRGLGIVQTFAVVVDGRWPTCSSVVSWLGTDNLAGESSPCRSRVSDRCCLRDDDLILLFRPRGLMGTRDT